MKKAVFYATAKGDTKAVCEYLAKISNMEIFNIEDTKTSKISEYDFIILASSTYGDGELAPAWAKKLNELNKINFKDKKVALIGVGNAARHSDHFAESINHFIDKIQDATLVGESQSEYKFNASKAFKDGKFIGLVLDTKGDSEYQKKIDKWVDDLKL